jgi:hypothetical protein
VNAAASELAHSLPHAGQHALEETISIEDQDAVLDDVEVERAVKLRLAGRLHHEAPHHVRQATRRACPLPRLEERASPIGEAAGKAVRDDHQIDVRGRPGGPPCHGAEEHDRDETVAEFVEPGVSRCGKHGAERLLKSRRDVRHLITMLHG